MSHNTIQSTDYKTAIGKMESTLGEPLSSSNTVVVESRKPQFTVSLANSEDFIKIATRYLGVESIKQEDVKVITLESLGLGNENKTKMKLR